MNFFVFFSRGKKKRFGKNRSFASELGFGMHHWLQRVGRVNGMLYFHRHGIAVGDANGDGRDDLFLCQPAGLPNKLFLNQEDGRAINVSRDFGVDCVSCLPDYIRVQLLAGEREITPGLALLEHSCSISRLNERSQD